MSNINQLVLLILEKDYISIHGHDRYKNYKDDIEPYFHNFATHIISHSPIQTPGYQHCSGKTNTKKKYHIIHINGVHGINSEYALGHDSNRKSQWFKFTKKINSDYWDLSSGVKILSSDVK